MANDDVTYEQRTVEALESIAESLEKLSDCVSRRDDEPFLRMVDVERGKVYKTHLGGNLRPSVNSGSGDAV